MSTKIEWCEETWNPITGCTPISEGCQHCYARCMATRLRGRYEYPRDDPFKVTFHPDRIEQPLKWRKPRRVFVCSMGDLFHEDVSTKIIHDVIQVALSEDQHKFLFLTKRPKRMAEVWHKVLGECEIIPHFWLGVTVESDKYRWRIEELLKIPAAVRFVSVEPMLGPIEELYEYFQWEQLHWVICGGETGPGARAIHPDWPRSLRDQCQAAGVPFFFKHWGSWMPDDFQTVTETGRTPKRCSVHSVTGEMFTHFYPYNAADMMWTPKHPASRLLDGREWNEYPSTLNL